MTKSFIISKFTKEQQDMLEELIEFTDDGGFNILGDVSGDVNGSVLGCVKGSVGSYIGGNVWGSISGWCGGDVKKDIEGDVGGSVCGNIKGNVHGNVEGNVGGSVCGNIKGNVHGNVEGSIKGNVLGDVMGEINVLGGDYNRRLVEMELAIKHLIESKDSLDNQINGMDGLEERLYYFECSIQTLEGDINSVEWDVSQLKESS
jgi:hypothetical protein